MKCKKVIKGRVLLIGPRLSPKGYGGVVVLFEDLIEQLKSFQLEFEVIDSNRFNYKNSFSCVFYVLFSFIKKSKDFSLISVHFKNNDFIYLAPLYIIIAKMLNKKISIRKFAGNFDQIFDRLGWFRKRVVMYSLRNADHVFFETKYLVNKFKVYNENTFWFPNSRQRKKVIEKESKVYSRKFIFVGNVCAEKGVNELLEASNKLNNDYSINIYGSVSESYFNSLDWSLYPNVKYHGEISSLSILKVISEHDVLLLPSYREGYPGVVIEALQAGLPVIASNLAGISEMITDGYEGYLVTPKDVDSLVEAIEAISKDNYKKLCDNALLKGKAFDSESVSYDFLKNMEALDG